MHDQEAQDPTVEFDSYYRLQDDPRAPQLTDLRTYSLAAIRLYEKCGFIKSNIGMLKLLTQPDDRR